MLLLFLNGFVAPSQVINFSDINFKIRLMQSSVNTNIAVDVNGNFMAIDANGDNEIQIEEALAVYDLDLNSSSITSLSGIEYFTNLRWFNCSGNQVASLNALSGLTNLNGINCMGCGLTSLAGIENLSTLQSVFFAENPISSVNLQNLPELWRIWGWNTQLSELNLCGTQVRTLWVNDNPNLTSLYLKNGVISSDLARTVRQIPPPLHNFEFGNTPLLSYICYDEGELPAILYAINQNTTGKTLTTTCNNTCALDNQTVPESIKVVFYPNPTTQFLQLTSSQDIQISEIAIFNMLGQLVLTANNNHSIDVSSLTGGHYLIVCATPKGKISKKFLKI
jgi:hypothetical protein